MAKLKRRTIYYLKIVKICIIRHLRTLKIHITKINLVKKEVINFNLGYQVQKLYIKYNYTKICSKYILDYYTIVVEDNQFKLNINNFIDKEEINTTYKYEDVTITINNVEINKENSIYNLTVKNDSENTIKLDGRESTKTVYITDKNGTKFKSMLYELLDEDLIIKPGEEKNIKIKFNIVYRDDLELKNIIFNDVIMDYDEYTKNKENVKKHKIVLGI